MTGGAASSSLPGPTFADTDDVAAVGRLERMARGQALGLLATETGRDALATAAGLPRPSVDCPRGQARRYPRTPGHFLPNACARIVILATSRPRWARQRAASLVSGRLGGWLGFTESFALDMNRVR